MLKDIAARAGVSVMTVSMALRNHPRISAVRRAELQSLASAMGYLRDPALAALSSYRRKLGVPAFQTNIALLHTARSAQVLARVKKPGGLYASARLYAAKLGYGLEFVSYDDFVAGRMALDRILGHRGVRGILLDASQLDEAQFNAFKSDRFATVAMMPSHRQFRAYHRVAGNHFLSMTLTLRACERLGYRRPALWLPRDNFRFGGQRWLGAFLEHHALEHPGSPPLYHIDDWDVASFRAWLEQAKPDCIITSGGGGVWHRDQLAAAGYLVPRDIGYCDLSLVDPTSGISGIWYDRVQLAQVAVNTLVGLIERNEYGPPVCSTSILMDGGWVEGTTVAARA
jgi:LacI family transcriptional regulator